MLLFVSTALTAQGVRTETYSDTNYIYVVQSDTTWRDSLPVVISTTKRLMTKGQASTSLFSLADSHKRILEAQPESQASFDRLKAVFESQSGITYDQALRNVVFGFLQGPYTYRYDGQNTAVRIQARNLVVNDTTSYNMNVIDRNTVRVRDLFGAGEHVIMRIRRLETGVRLIGIYNNKNVLLIRRDGT